MPIGKRDMPQRLRNVLALRRLIRARDIHVVHAHSRAAAWVAFFATRFSRVPLVSTLHAAPAACTARCACSASTARRSRRSPPAWRRTRSVTWACRASACTWWRTAPTWIASGRGVPPADARRALGLPSDGPLIALVGRLSGPRGPVARFVVAEVFPRVHAAVPGARLVVVGGMRGRRGLPRRGRRHQRAPRRRVGAPPRPPGRRPPGAGGGGRGDRRGAERDECAGRGPAGARARRDELRGRGDRGDGRGMPPDQLRRHGRAAGDGSRRHGGGRDRSAPRPRAPVPARRVGPRVRGAALRREGHLAAHQGDLPAGAGPQGRPAASRW